MAHYEDNEASSSGARGHDGDGSWPRACFSCARDLFDATRDAAMDAERVGRMLAASAERAAAVGRPSSPRPGGSPRGHGPAPDRMRAVDQYVDQERRVRRRQEEDYRLIDLACDVIYGRGQDGTGGVCALLGAPHADALWWRYCGTAPWPVVAARVGMSEGWCKRACATAMDVVDHYGWRRVADGVGDACDRS